MVKQNLFATLIVVAIFGWTPPAFADRPEAVEAKEERRAEPPKLKLDHVIHGIDSLYLVDFAFYFDGGSLSFSFAEDPEVDSDDAVVFVCLPNPYSGLIQPTPPGQLIKQTVLASPHSRMTRFAVSASSDPDYEAFVKLIREAQIAKPTKELPKEELQEALGLVQAAVVDGIKPKEWSGEAFEKYRKLRK